MIQRGASVRHVSADSTGLLSYLHAPKFAASTADALGAIRTWMAHPAHEFWPDDLQADDELMPEIRGHQLFTNAYLFALARKRGGKLATLDTGVRSLVAGAPAHLELV